MLSAGHAAAQRARCQPPEPVLRLLVALGLGFAAVGGLAATLPVPPAEAEVLPSPPAAPPATPAPPPSPPRAAEAPASVVPASGPPAVAPDAQPAPQLPKPAAESSGPPTFDGWVSFYARRFVGRRTASGEVYDPHAMTMAHRSLPFGTWVRITHLANGRSVLVRVNDRGPWTGGRLADLSMAAARQLGMVAQGVARVRLEHLGDPPDAR